MANQVPCSSDPTYGLLLTFIRTQSPLFSPLSTNIIREVVAYIDTDPILIGIQGKTLMRYNLRYEHAHITVKIPAIDCTGCGFALLNPSSLLLVGGASDFRSVRVINTYTGAVRTETPLIQGRVYPGVVAYEDYIWVFGGRDDQHVLSSALKYHKTHRQWTALPDMTYPKIPVPCERNGAIFLPGLTNTGNRLEIYSTRGNVYTKGSVCLNKYIRGFCCFILDSTFILISGSERAEKWQFPKHQEALDSMKIRVKPGELGTFPCQGTPVRYNEAVYWVGASGTLHKYSISTKSVKMCKKRDANPPKTAISSARKGKMPLKRINSFIGYLGFACCLSKKEIDRSYLVWVSLYRVNREIRGHCGWKVAVSDVCSVLTPGIGCRAHLP